jgi:hypothetical protein
MLPPLIRIGKGRTSSGKAWSQGGRKVILNFLLKTKRIPPALDRDATGDFEDRITVTGFR